MNLIIYQERQMPYYHQSSPINSKRNLTALVFTDINVQIQVPNNNKLIKLYQQFKIALNKKKLPPSESNCHAGL